MAISGEKAVTGAEPMKSVIAEMMRAEDRSGVLAASVFSGQPWADTANTGASVVVIPRTEGVAARFIAKELALKLWAGRRDYRFHVDALEPDEAVRRALQETGGATFLADTGDNVTAGAPGDNAFLLKKILQAGAASVLVAGITDPPCVRRCLAAQPGTPVEGHLGAELDPASSERVFINGTLVSTGDILGRDGENAGKAAVISLSGLDVVVTERRCAFTSPEIFHSLGIDLKEYGTIVVKLGYLFPRLETVAHKAIMALTPGASSQRLETLPFRKIGRPVYPLDDVFDWMP